MCISCLVAMRLGGWQCRAQTLKHAPDSWVLKPGLPLSTPKLGREILYTTTSWKWLLRLRLQQNWDKSLYTPLWVVVVVYRIGLPKYPTSQSTTYHAHGCNTYGSRPKTLKVCVCVLMRTRTYCFRQTRWTCSGFPGGGAHKSWIAKSKSPVTNKFSVASLKLMLKWPHPQLGRLFVQLLFNLTLRLLHQAPRYWHT